MPSYVATLADGTTIVDENLFERGENFTYVLAANKAGLLKQFRVFLDDGGVFGTDLMTGQIEVDGNLYTPSNLPKAPLRIIYYKTMQATLAPDDNQPVIEMVCITVGWQATVDGKNIRAGIKVYPAEARYELTEEI